MNIIGSKFFTVATAATLFTTSLGGSLESDMGAESAPTAQSYAVTQTASTSPIITIDRDATAGLVDGTIVWPFITEPIKQALKCLLCTLESVEIDYPRDMSSTSETKGVIALKSFVMNTPGTLVLGGFSQGSNVIGKWIDEQVKSGNPIRTDEIIVVRYGAPGSINIPDSPYAQVVIGDLYDPIAGWPNPFNLLAVANAAAGLGNHLDNYEDLDVNDPAVKKWVRQDGNTTLVFIEPERLPILGNFLYNIGIGYAIDPLLRKIINSAYKLKERGFVLSTEPVIAVEGQAPAATQFVAGPVHEISPSRQAVEEVTDTAPRRGKLVTLDIPSIEPEAPEPSQEMVVDEESSINPDEEIVDSDPELTTSNDDQEETANLGSQESEDNQDASEADNDASDSGTSAEKSSDSSGDDGKSSRKTTKRSKDAE